MSKIELLAKIELLNKYEVMIEEMKGEADKSTLIRAKSKGIGNMS